MQRRCVHDEYGRVDPAKAAEPTKPRGSGTSKRPVRLSDDFSHGKRPRTADETAITMSDDIDSMIDPALMSGEINAFVIDYSQHSMDFSPVSAQNGQVIRTAEIKNDAASPTADVFMTDYTEAPVNTETTIVKSTETELPASNVKVETDLEGTIPTDAWTPILGNQPNFSPLTAASQPELDNPGKPEQPTNRETPFAQASRHSSRQPKQVDRYVPEDNRSPFKTNAKVGRGERRASSSAVSAHTIISTTKSRRSSSNTSGTTHQVGMMGLKRRTSRETSVRPISRGSTGQESDMDADERLARELQAAENGLRRRTSMRV